MQDMVKAINQLSYRHNTSKVFSDFVEVSAIAVSNAVNAVDLAQFEQREKRYMDIVKQYKKRNLTNLLRFWVCWLIT